MTRLFVNVSNHPSTGWADEQREAALRTADQIVDLAFPPVPADADSSTVWRMAREYADRIFAMRTESTDVAAVMVQGEFTFVYALVRLLSGTGIPCLAATTERRTVDLGDGRKVAQFQFVRFRAYEPSTEEVDA